ncbi:MAG: hypothetical protein ACE5E9_10750 [Nitrospinaceae bacterium]
MKLSAKLSILLILFLYACTGANTEVKKSWKNNINTLAIVDLTSKNYDLMDAGARLFNSLENSIDKTGFHLAGKNAKYQLKFKIVEYDSGNRLARLATLGIADSAKAKLKVKAALYSDDVLVGGWVVDSWLKGGIVGGSEDKVFAKAAEEIVQHLKGEY